MHQRYVSQVHRELNHDHSGEGPGDLGGLVRPAVHHDQGGVGPAVDGGRHLLEHAADVELLLVGADRRDDLLGLEVRVLGLERFEGLLDGELSQIGNSNLL